MLDAWRRHLRLSILKLLASAPGYSANDSVMTDALRGVGFGATRDQVRTEIQWLAEQGLVKCEVMERLLVATVTGRGREVATGHALHEGVQRPSPSN